MSWDEGYSTCLSLGADLVSVHSDEENTYIYILCGSENACWLGFSDVIVEGDWEWSDGSTVDFTKWEDGQPDNAWNQDYARIQGEDALWDDEDPGKADTHALCKKKDTLPAIVWSECYGDICYYKTPSQMTWTEAHTTCVGLGVELASIHSIEEDTFIYNVCGYTNDCWIGLTDEQVEGVWIWSDGSIFNYANWANNEPND